MVLIDVEENVEFKRLTCSNPNCTTTGVYRYAPYDFENNWSENERWRCEEHGKQYYGDPEWDYFEHA